jgi:hypothetical protein
VLSGNILRLCPKLTVRSRLFSPSGALELARGTALAAGALAEGDVQLAARALARAVAAPGLAVVHEGLALSGDVYTSVLAIGRAAAPLAPSRNGHPVCA